MQSNSGFRSIVRWQIRVLCAVMMLSLFPALPLMAQEEDGRFVVPQEDAAQPDIGVDLNMPQKKQEIWGPESDVFKAMPPDIQELILQEVQTVYNNCMRKDLYSKLHDCRCVSVYFLDSRLREGPKRDRNMILEKIGAVCPNPVGAAGAVFERCRNFYTYKKYKNTDEYCGCVANDVALAYKNRPKPSHSYLADLTVAGHKKCREIAEEE